MCFNTEARNVKPSTETSLIEKESDTILVKKQSTNQDTRFFLQKDDNWLATAGLEEEPQPQFAESLHAAAAPTHESTESSHTVALVTGARRGIGRKVAEQLLSQGVYVVATCTSPTEVARLKEELSQHNRRTVVVAALDVRKEDQIYRLADVILHYFGKLDILINNAGVMDQDPSTVETQSVRDWNNIIAVNLTGTFLLCKAMIPLLRRAGKGVIVNLSGGLGTFSSGMQGGGYPAYRVSKAGVNALTLTLSEELIQERIIVNAVDPVWVKTDMGGPDAPRTAAEAAEDVVHAAMLSLEDKVVGRLLRDRMPVDY